jgi:formylglycine-generating enzyme
VISFKQAVRSLAIVVAILSVAVARADVFNMGPGVKNLETVPVGDAGNVADKAAHSANPNGQGAVAYNYNIGKYEVTAAQYCEFLNAVGGVDTYELYEPQMADMVFGCGIIRSGGGASSNPYRYSVASDFANHPVNFVSWADSARFVNWLQNNQPTGGQNLSTTEDGTYFLNGATTDEEVATLGRKAGCKWTIPTADEWYKAAFYKGNGLNSGYWDFPTSNDAAPGNDIADVSGNNSNYAGALHPDGHLTTVVGTFHNSESPYGTFDQGGNVWEWNETVMYDVKRGFRGGCFFDDAGTEISSGYGCAFYPVTECIGTLGFRVASVPEPGTLAMLGGVAVVALLWCSRKVRHSR